MSNLLITWVFTGQRCCFQAHPNQFFGFIYPSSAPLQVISVFLVLVVIDLDLLQLSLSLSSRSIIADDRDSLLYARSVVSTSLYPLHLEEPERMGGSYFVELGRSI